jgi:hypothetical protein
MRIQRASRVALVAVGLCLVLTAAVSAATTTWIRQWGTSARDNTWDVATGPNGAVYATGGLASDSQQDTDKFFLRKYNAAGQLSWERKVHGSTIPYNIGKAVIADSTGVYVAAKGEVTPGAITYVRKYDLDGHVVWTQKWDVQAEDYATEPLDLAIRGDNLYLLLEGGYSGLEVHRLQTSNGARSLAFTVDEGGFNDPTCTGIDVDASGVYLACDERNPNGNTEDARLIKFDYSGVVLWGKWFKSAGYDTGVDVAVDSTGVYFAFYTEKRLPGFPHPGREDSFVAAYTAGGTQRWIRQIATSQTDFVDAITSDGTRVFAAGSTGGRLGQRSFGLPDIWVRAWDADGTKLWTKQFGTSTSEFVSGIAEAGNAVYVGGDTYGSLQGHVKGDSDAILARLNK